MKLVDEFKTFISQGNVMDMAVGVVVGGAFKGIIDSLVADIIMPLITSVTGKVDVTGLVFKIGQTNIPYGNFIQAIINFLIIAVCIFFVVKGANIIKEKTKKKKQKIAEASGPTQEELLAEIRDLLKKTKE